MTPTAEKRLKTIFQATELGAGFSIALKDLEIRGAGTLLGVKQSGHITAVGFNLYCRLLTDAVEEQKARRAGVIKPPPHLPPPTIDLPLRAYIPEDYVPDLNTRLSLYQRLVKIDNAGLIDDLAQEFGDRFGTPPPAARNLLYALKIKILAAKARIESIDTEDKQIVIRRFQGMPFDKQKLQPVLQDGIMAGTSQLRLHPKRLGKAWQQVLEEVLRRVG